jgi:hypothetical protein
METAMSNQAVAVPSPVLAYEPMLISLLAAIGVIVVNNAIINVIAYTPNQPTVVIKINYPAGRTPSYLL